MARIIHKEKMVKYISLFLAKPIVTWVFIPFVLFVFWIGLSYTYIATRTGISVLTYSESKANYSSWKTTELLKGQKVTGHFIAEENYLGIVAVRFQNFNRISKDSVIFRIKEQNANDWFYQNQYLVNQFQNNQLFTFGMPVISNSIGKAYVFEIESVRGTHGDAIGLSKKEPVFVTKYQFPKKLIFTNKKVLLKFIIAKPLEVLSNSDFIISSTIYLLPLLYYLLLKIIFSKFSSYRKYHDVLKIIYYSPLILIQIGVLLSVFLETTIYNFIIFIISVLWVITLSRYGLSSRTTLLIATCLLIVSPFIMILVQLQPAENTAIWAFIFLCIGVLQQIYEFRTNNIYAKEY